MKKAFAVAAFLLGLQCASVGAVTIEPLPGTTPQATHIGAYFPVEMGVVVRDDLGQPVAGAPVRFLLSDLMSTFINAGGIKDMVTDANGVAIPPMHVAINNGVSYMEATTPDAAAPARFDIEVFGEIPKRMDLLSGQSQTVQVNGLFPQRIVVQVFAPNHTQVPYAGVQFYLRPDAVPSGLFEPGVNTLFVKADANGVAMAPNIVANGIVGQEYGSALSVRTEHNTQHAWASELFKYRIVAP
jgi:hypothetical protein